MNSNKRAADRIINQLIEALELTLFAVTVDADTNDGNVDREAIAEVAKAAINKANAHHICGD